MNKVESSELLVIACNFSGRSSGVTSTLENVVAEHKKKVGVAVLGGLMPESIPIMSWLSVWRLWSKPGGRPFRIWHARRNVEMIYGVVFRDILRMPLALVFTSASQRLHSRLTRYLIKKMDAVIATSQASAKFLRRQAYVIPHGMDCEKFHPASDPTAERESLEIPDKLVIGCFGRIRFDKGTDLFVDALIPVMKKNPEVHGLVVGLTSAKHKNFEKSIKARIAENSLTDRFSWFGEVPGSQLPKLYRCLNIYIAPQRWEGFGVTPLEAMASGIPVIAGRVGAFEDLIVDGQTGYLIARDNLTEIQKSVELLLDEDQKQKKMGAAGREHVCKNFSISVEADSIYSVYLDLWNRSDRK